MSSRRDEAVLERIHSDTWWKIKTGWTDEEYLARKNALFRRIRETGASPYEEDILDKIEPLVATFDDRSWCLPGEQDRAVIFNEQLRLYQDWAEHIFHASGDMDNDDLFTISLQVTGQPYPLLNESAHITTTTVKLFDWTDVEICVDSKVKGRIQHIIPMVKLGTDELVDTYHWTSFKYEKFLKYLQQEQKIYFDDDAFDVYWITESEWFPIDNDSDYKIMLKRFMEAPTENKTIEILIEKRKKDGATAPKLYPNKKAGSLKRKAPPA